MGNASPSRRISQFTFLRTAPDEGYFLPAGPAHRFKRLCEKLQTILFSDVRKNLAEEKRRESEEKTPRGEEDLGTANKLQLTHLSDTESDGEL